ncbi:hypothetical protein [Ilumatobacter sp.]|uniref:hypothetical protein n=1 Tax=Ilumatobacter sp. TaxID=1967498 RepID=UPI0037518374
MDFSKFKTSDWLIVGGGVLTLIGGLFLDWLKADGFGGGAHAFDFTLTGALPWILLIAAAVITVLLVLGKLDSKTQPWPLIVLGGTVLAALLLLIRVIFNPGAPDGISRGLGMLATFVAALIATAGAFLSFQASGGKLSDLADINKLKASFAGGNEADSGDMPPPPPAQ